MAVITDLSKLSVEDREKHLAVVRREALEFRDLKLPIWLEIFSIFRGLQDTSAPTRARLYSSYAWSAVQSWMSVLEPIFFSSIPTFDLRSPRDEDRTQNDLLEQLLTQQIHFQSNFRSAWTKMLLEALVFGSSYPWTYFRTIYKQLGPFRTPVLDAEGMPALDPADGAPLVRLAYKTVRTCHAPWTEPISLWDSVIHPDSRRGFSRVLATGYELLQSSTGPNALYERSRVERILKAGALFLGSGSRRSSENFIPGDDSQVIEDELALLAGTQVGMRLDDYREGHVKDVLSMKFPVLHYDDGDFTGTYALNKDGRLYELRFNVGASPDGEGNRMAILPYTSPQEVYGVGCIEQSLPLLRAHTRFLQLALDGAALTVHPMWLVSQQYDQLVGEIVTGPGSIIVAPTMGNEDPRTHVQRLDMPQSWYNALQFQEHLQKELDQLWAQDDFSRGRFSGGRKTAEEVNNVMQFAASRMEVIAERIASQFGTPLGKKWLCMDSIHLSQQDVTDVLGVKAEGIQIPDVETIIRQMRVVFRGSVLSSNSSMKLAQIQNLAKAYFESLPVLQRPDVQDFMRRWFELAGLEGVTKNFPPIDPNMMTRLDQLGMNAAMQGRPGTTGVPETPTDLSGMLRAQGGAKAPPPPASPSGGGPSPELGGF